MIHQPSVFVCVNQTVKTNSHILWPLFLSALSVCAHSPCYQDSSAERTSLKELFLHLIVMVSPVWNVTVCIFVQLESIILIMTQTLTLLMVTRCSLLIEELKKWFCFVFFPILILRYMNFTKEIKHVNSFEKWNFIIDVFVLFCFISQWPSIHKCFWWAFFYMDMRNEYNGSGKHTVWCVRLAFVSAALLWWWS